MPGSVIFTCVFIFQSFCVPLSHQPLLHQSSCLTYLHLSYHLISCRWSSDWFQENASRAWWTLAQNDFNTIYKVDALFIEFPWWGWWWNRFSPQMSFSRRFLDDVLAAGVSTTGSRSLAFTLFQQLEVEQTDSRRQHRSKRSKVGGTEPICQPEQSHLAQQLAPDVCLLLIITCERANTLPPEAQNFPKYLKGLSGDFFEAPLC